MDLDRALEYALDGDAILFVGAGFSLGAKNLRAESFKTGRQLAAHLATGVGLSADTPLDDAAEEFARKHSSDQLIVELQQEYSAFEVAEHHLSIAGIPWKRIYTTNYDNVLETASTRLSRRLNPVTPADHIRAIPKDTSLCVHLNGYIDRLNRDTLWSDFKLTDTSYVQHLCSSLRGWCYFAKICGWLALPSLSVTPSQISTSKGFSLTLPTFKKRPFSSSAAAPTP